MIQRYPGCVRGKWTPDKYVLFTDHKADKAEAVAEAVAEETKKLRAELVALLARPTLLHAICHGDGCYHVRLFSDGHVQCDRLVELGAWKNLGSNGKFVRYRPVEPRSSGGRDEAPTSD